MFPSVGWKTKEKKETPEPILWGVRGGKRSTSARPKTEKIKRCFPVYPKTPWKKTETKGEA